MYFYSNHIVHSTRGLWLRLFIYLFIWLVQKKLHKWRWEAKRLNTMDAYLLSNPLFFKKEVKVTVFKLDLDLRGGKIMKKK